MNRFFNVLTALLLSSALVGGSATLSLTNFNENDGSVDVAYSSDTPIAGFQFDLSGFDNLSTSGGAAAAAGFTVSTGGSTVIGFSLTGSTIPAGEGVLLTLDVTGDASATCISNIVLSDSSGAALEYDATCTSFSVGSSDVEGCTDASACNFDSDATVDDGSCDYGTECWDGSYECNASDCPDQPGGELAIYYDTDTPIAGFQFGLDNVNITGASGGDATANGFTVSSSGTTVIGFSLTGSTIPAGDGVLINITYEGSDPCLTDLEFSDAAGSALPDEADCASIVIDAVEDGIYGCTDESACNFDSEANTDDGSCEYAAENFDCDGNCIAEEDCDGGCGGDAVDVGC